MIDAPVLPKNGYSLPFTDQEWKMPTPQVAKSAKIRVLLLSIHYPVAMASYFIKAFQNRADVELLTCGPYTANFIPWKGGMTVPMKYAKPPSIPLPLPPNIGHVDFELAQAQFPAGWHPDLVLTVDAGINWTHKPSEGFVATVGTDPHVLNYDYPRRISDKFFNMQKCYMAGSDIYLPYAYSRYDHYPMPEIEKDTDAVLIGLQYAHRNEWVEALRKHGVSVIYETGPSYDEYRELNNKARIGLNWSSLQDTNARFFELAAMRLAPVMNRTPDADLFLTPNDDYLAFTNLDEAVNSVLVLNKNANMRNAMSEEACKHIQGQTYDSRVAQILKECRLI